MQVTEALQAVGGRSLAVCDASWATEQWPVFGLEEFPDLAALQRHQQLLDELQWSRYIDSTTLVGTPLAMP